MILFACNEGAYLFNETYSAIKSLAKVMPEQRVLLMLIEGSDKHFEAIKSWHPNIEVIKYQPKFAVSTADSGFYFYFKVLVLHEALTIAKEALLFLDGDILVRKNLSEIFEVLENFDFTIRYRPQIEMLGPMGTMGAAKFNSGVMGLAYNDRTLSFASKIKESTELHISLGKSPVIYSKERQQFATIDQEVLFEEFKKAKNKIRFWPLPSSFNDAYFGKNSEIWHAKGVRKDHPLYKIAVSSLEGSEMQEKDKRTIEIAEKKEEKEDERFLKQTAAFYKDEIISELYNELSDGAKILIINSNFVVYNKLPLRHEVTCLDISPVWFQMNKDYMINLKNVRHSFEPFSENIDTSKYDAIIVDYAFAVTPRSEQKVLELAKDLGQYLRLNGEFLADNEIAEIKRGSFVKTNW